MLSHTSTEWAPWYVIPADRKWFARIGVGVVLAHALMDIDPGYPQVSKQQRQVLLEAKAARSEAQAPKGAAPDPFLEAGRSGEGGAVDGRRRPTHERRVVAMAGAATLVQRSRGGRLDDARRRSGGRGSPVQKAAELLDQPRPQRALPVEQQVPGWKRFVEQQYRSRYMADHPARRRDRFARDQGVDHRCGCCC